MKIFGLSIDLLIFDLDGTLYDSSGLARKLTMKVLFGLKSLLDSRHARKEMMGIDYKSAETLYKELFTKMDPKEPQKARKWYFSKFYPAFVETLKKGFSKRPFIDRLLKHLKDGAVQTAVLSDYGEIEERLKAIGIEPELFDMLSSCEERAALKPAPRPFLELAQQADTPPERCMVVGDRSDSDIEGARRAGMHYMKIGRSEKDTQGYKYSMMWQDFVQGILEER